MYRYLIGREDASGGEQPVALQGKNQQLTRQPFGIGGASHAGNPLSQRTDPWISNAVMNHPRKFGITPRRSNCNTV